MTSARTPADRLGSVSSRASSLAPGRSRTAAATFQTAVASTYSQLPFGLSWRPRIYKTRAHDMATRELELWPLPDLILAKVGFPKDLPYCFWILRYLL